MPKDASEETLRRSIEDLKTEENILEAAEAFLTVEKEVEPDFAPDAPDFALGRIAAQTEEKPKSAPPSLKSAMTRLRREAAQTKADQETVAAENAAVPDFGET